jgi:hypothetical protein
MTDYHQVESWHGFCKIYIVPMNLIMIAQKHIREAFQYVSRSITSSNSLLQLETAERMVGLFRRQNIYPELSEKLDEMFVNKAEALHYFEWKRFRDFGAYAA